jgi:cellulose synthase/poly-beta-1,6-N-acetylglucosamine synthase-like glycosyltransferase
MTALGTKWAVGVVVPACDEETSIERCIESVLIAMGHCEARNQWLVVVADRCRDRTVALARRRLKGLGEVIECDAGEVGTARHIGTCRVLETFAGVPTSQLWLANTDADTHVPPDWLSRHLRLAATGITAVAGVVSVDDFNGHGPRGAAVFSANYPLERDGSHRHIHGANLGFRADSYLDCGGWQSQLVGEDHCLWARIKARGWPTLATVSSQVTTSGRLSSRVHGGFADTLRANLDRARYSACDLSLAPMQ